MIRLEKDIHSIVIISASSDIGHFLAMQWLKEDRDIVGTYRTYNDDLGQLVEGGARLFQCDLNDSKSIKALASEIDSWDVLLLCPGTMEPVGRFDEIYFDKWKESININFSSQLEVVHQLLPKRNVTLKKGPIVIFFAGGGTNNATIHYSAYTVSKIALIKMVELLDAEFSDMRFSIIGPGWVKTKILNQTLQAREKAGANYEKTVERLRSGVFTELDAIYQCCNWLINSDRVIVSGRNFSVVNDKWGTEELSNELLHDQDMYKLRRYKN